MERSYRLKSTSFSLVELLIVIAIMAILISLLMPSLQLLNYEQKNLQCSIKLKDINIVWTLYAEDNEEYYPRINTAPGARQRHPWEITTNRVWPLYSNDPRQYIGPYIEDYISGDGGAPSKFKAFFLTECPLATPKASAYKGGIDELWTASHQRHQMPYAIFGGADTPQGRSGPLKVGDTWIQSVPQSGSTPYPGDPHEVEMQILAGDHTHWTKNGVGFVTTQYARPSANYGDDMINIGTGWSWIGYPDAEHTANYLWIDGSVANFKFKMADITSYRGNSHSSDHTFFVSGWGDAIYPYDGAVKDPFGY